MAGPARVVAVEVFGEFRTALSVFRDDVADALVAVDLECQRILDWLKTEQLDFWKKQHRRFEEKLNEARGDLHRKKITAMDGNNSFVDEKATIKKCQRAVEEADRKMTLCRKWAQAAGAAIEEYQASAQGLTGTLEIDLPKALNRLATLMKAVDAYLEVALPRTGIGTAGAASLSSSSPEGPARGGDPLAAELPSEPPAAPAEPQAPPVESPSDKSPASLES